ncbi:MAG: cell division regulator GpsB [Thomasclavelia sp.]|uniref:cell division regulator GpsB n=1 Tax=Thomasclavelia sp. TaxID=3025757 RepID=UPI0039A2DF77
MEPKILLSPKKIVAKEFKVDFKGYNAEEVDHFLDMIVKDYEAFAAMLNASYDKIDQLEARLSEQKIKIAKLEREKALQDDNIHAMEENLSTNVDILKRLSLLEKVVFNQNK